MKIKALSFLSAVIMLVMSFSSPASAASPPSWLQMTMPDVTYNSVTNKLAVVEAGINAPLAANTNTGNGNLAAGVGDYSADYWSVLHGKVFSRRLGWNDPSFSYPYLQDQINNIYGFLADNITPRGYIWIQSLSQSPGLNSYLAVGNWGVNADGSMTPDLLNPTGVPYSGIFGTNGSSTKWKWDTMMDHNSYAVPFTSLTQPNQIFSAYYKLYIGDATGNELLTDRNGNAVASAATTTTWTWQGPAFTFIPRTGATVSTLFESTNAYTHAGAATPVSITGGEYAISTDGGLTWGVWTSAAGTIADTNQVKVRQTSSANPGTTTEARLAIATAVGPGTFYVTTLGPDTVPAAFSFNAMTSAVSVPVESGFITVTAIDTPAPISVSGGEYAISTDSGATWGAFTATSGTVSLNNRVKLRLTSAATTGTAKSATLNIGGVTGMFTVTTATPVAPSASFASRSNVPANTSVSGMPFYVTSNPLLVTANSTISISGGITPQYSVSTDNGQTWSDWSTTSPASVATGNHVKVRVVPATTAFTTSTTNLNLGGTLYGFNVTTGFANPPSWMPMAMLNVAYDSTAKKLTVQDLHTHASFPGATLPALTYIPAGAYDPTKPWGHLSSGVYLSRQLGWDDNTALHGTGLTVIGGLINQITAAYGAGAGIWIELISKTPGLETYFTDGMFGVGGTSSSALSGTPQPYSSMMTGFPIIYSNNYNGIFGTGGSSAKWKWDGTMIHNVYAVPAAYVTQPDQVFSATYKVYVGDAAGNEILNADSSTTSTLETWSWKAPAAITPSAIPLDWVGADVNNTQGTLVAWWPASYTPGVTFTVTATPATGTPVSVSGIAAQHYTFNNLPNGVYTISVKAEKAGMQSSIKSATGTATLNKVVKALEWVGVSSNNKNISIWWPASATPGATYTVFVNGTQAATGLAANQYLYTAPANGTYNVTVQADLATWTSSTPTAPAAAVVINVTNPAYAWLGAQNSGTTVKLWWPTITGATVTIIDNGTPITPTILTAGGLSYVIMTGQTNGSHTYTIQNTTVGYIPSAVTTSATLTL